LENVEIFHLLPLLVNFIFFANSSLIFIAYFLQRINYY